MENVFLYPCTPPNPSIYSAPPITPNNLSQVICVMQSLTKSAPLSYHTRPACFSQNGFTVPQNSRMPGRAAFTQTLTHNKGEINEKACRVPYARAPLP